MASKSLSLVTCKNHGTAPIISSAPPQTQRRKSRHGTRRFYLVAEVHLVVERVELELDAVPARLRHGPAPPGLLPVVDALLDAAVLAPRRGLLAGEPLGEALGGGRDVGHHPVRPRHDGALRVRRVDVLHHQRQRPRAVGDAVPLQRRRHVLLRPLTLQRVLPRQTPVVRRDRVRHQPQALLRHACDYAGAAMLRFVCARALFG
uniref:Uncharacterized protein n=1 Tax=Setaria italica TaxID=4555 RepID=K3Z9Q5_SETIT